MVWRRETKCTAILEGHGGSGLRGQIDGQGEEKQFHFSSNWLLLDAFCWQPRGVFNRPSHKRAGSLDQSLSERFKMIISIMCHKSVRYDNIY